MSRKFPYAERAERARDANRALNAAAMARRRGADGRWDSDHPTMVEWRRCVEVFWAAMRDAAPMELEEATRQVRRGDPVGAEQVIEFLEADPYYFGSGYLKANLLRWLGRVPLNASQMQRLRAVVLKVVALGWRREFRRYCTFAKRLDAPPFRHELARLTASRDVEVSKRARRVLNALEGLPSIWHKWQARQLMSAEEQEAAREADMARMIETSLERLQQYRHQMDTDEAEKQLEFIALLGSVDVEELRRRLDHAPGDAPT